MIGVIISYVVISLLLLNWTLEGIGLQWMLKIYLFIGVICTPLKIQLWYYFKQE